MIWPTGIMLARIALIYLGVRSNQVPPTEQLNGRVPAFITGQMSSHTFSVSNILGKSPNDPKLEDIYKLDKQLGRCAKWHYGTILFKKELCSQLCSVSTAVH